MGSIIDRALDIINDHLKDQTSSFSDPVTIKPMARGGGVASELLKNLKKKNPEAIRRARALGYDVNNIYFHGTDKDIRSFEQIGPGGNLGVYVAKDPGIAEVYARKNNDRYGTSGANIIPVFAKKGSVELTNPVAQYYKVSDPSHIRSVFADFDENKEGQTDLLAARGGYILEDKYPSHYMPGVGRQVMAEGGMTDDPIGAAVSTARNVSEAPDIPPPAPAPVKPGFEGRVGAVPKPTLGSLFEEGKVPSGAPWSERAETEEARTPTIQGLTDAVKKAIEHHTSLPYKERIKNGKEAISKLIPYVGVKKDAPIVPLIGQNAKLMKAQTGTDTTEPLEIDGLGVETAGLSLSPAFKMGKVDTCPNHFSCKDSCLGKKSGYFFRASGGKDLSAFKGPRLNSLNKTLALMQEPEAFAVRLYDELMTAKTMAHLNGSRYGFRLNNISDLPPSIWKPIIDAHPDIDFYDYTKMNYDPVAPNHHVTYSSTGVSQDDIENPNQNWHQVRKRLDGGDNVAMSFTVKSGSPLPEVVHDEETGKKYRVIDGDTHDFRPLDKVGEGEDGVIIGLHNKDDASSSDTAHIDSKGFLVKYDPKYKTIGKSKTNFERDEFGDKIPTNKTVIIKPQPKKPSRAQITRSKGSANV